MYSIPEIEFFAARASKQADVILLDLALACEWFFSPTERV
jgi:hypothetical protein